MSAPMENVEPAEMCEIEATVVTGFEPMAKEEIKEMFDVVASTDRGKVNFSIPVTEASKVLQLNSVDNLYVIIKHIDNFTFNKNIKDDLDQFVRLVPNLDWKLGLSVWKQFFSFDHPVSHLPKAGWEERFKDTDVRVTQKLQSQSAKDTGCSGDEENPQKKLKPDTTDNERSVSGEAVPPVIKAAKKEANPALPSFRATCYRTGRNHSFRSEQAAAEFGGAIQDYFCWNVNLKNHDIEVVLIVDSEKGYVAIALTRGSQHKRNITHFGYTTLRSTIAYNMLRLCNIQPGDVVCDPMCGGGTIPIEAAINWPGSKHICGDIHELASPRCQANFNSVNSTRTQHEKKPVKADIFLWDTTQLPLKTSSVDVFVTDMPFGKRSGSLMRNWHLYPKTLSEMARCAKTGTGRATLLTHDKKCMTKTLGMVKSYWSVAKVVGINIGGLAACVWCLKRTLKEFTGPVDKKQVETRTTQEKS